MQSPDTTRSSAPSVGQHQMWATQYYRYTIRAQFISSGGLGTMGFWLPGGHRRQDRPAGGDWSSTSPATAGSR